MNTGIIDTSRIQSMVAQMQTIAAKAQPGVGAVEKGSQADGPVPVDFAQALKSSLDQVSGLQKTSENLSQRFAIGDDSVNLSDMMIAMQKASIGMQATIQVRNKLVSAYESMMNMQV